MQTPRVLSASSITSDDVRNHSGDDLGSVKDLMIELETGKVRYAVVSFGGLLGIGNKLLAIPFSAFSVDPEQQCFILDADRSKLENAPGFDPDSWPDFGDPSLTEPIDRFYQ